MPTLASIVAELKRKGSEKTRQVYANHGNNPDRAFGVSVADLKVVAKSIKGQQDLACALYATGNLDAMYLAGMVADGSKMSRQQLNQWAAGAEGLQMVSEYTVAWVAVESPLGRDLALEWMDSAREHIAASGWCTYSGLAATKPDADLDLAEIQGLLDRIAGQIHRAPNRVRSTMNAFVIAVGTYVTPLLKQANATAKQIGEVSIDTGATACKVAVATASIEKAKVAGKLGKKRKTIRC